MSREWLRIVVLVVALGVFAVAQIGGMVSDYRSAEAALERAEVDRCLTGYRLKLLDGPEARALRALADDDDEAYRAAVEAFDVDTFEDLNRQARLDVEGFLRDCRAVTP